MPNDWFCRRLINHVDKTVYIIKKERKKNAKLPQQLLLSPCNEFSKLIILLPLIIHHNQKKITEQNYVFFFSKKKIKIFVTITLKKTHLQGFSIRGNIPVMEAPPIDPNLVYELKIGFHCFAHKNIKTHITSTCTLINAKIQKIGLIELSLTSSLCHSQWICTIFPRPILCSCTKWVATSPTKCVPKCNAKSHPILLTYKLFVRNCLKKVKWY